MGSADHMDVHGRMHSIVKMSVVCAYRDLMESLERKERQEILDQRE